MEAVHSQNSTGGGPKVRPYGRRGRPSGRPQGSPHMTSNIDYIDKIPNIVDLGRDRVLQRALEHWQPAYMGWWYDMGPNESHNYDVYLRTAISVDPEGWAQFDYVKMPQYRWGIFLAPPTQGREVNFGANKGQPAWQDVPGEY